MAICINLQMIPQHTHKHEKILVNPSDVLDLPGWCWAQGQQLATICSRSSLFNDIGSRKPLRSVVLAALSGSKVSDHPRDAWSWHLAAHIRYWIWSSLLLPAGAARTIRDCSSKVGPHPEFHFVPPSRVCCA